MLMNGLEKVVKHLEMTQAIINRLGSNSFQLKGWSMTLIVAAMVLLARYDLQNPTIILAFILPILGFWTATFCGRRGCSERSTMRSGSKTTPTSRWM